MTIMGLGRFGGGVGAARWFTRQGAQVTVTDLASEADLAESLSQLADEPIAAFHLGGHCEEDFRSADLVVVNPAVKPGNPFLKIAERRGTPVVTEIEVFLRQCPGRIIGVTGSNGKSTTTAMIAGILRAAGRKVWLGGNLGGSLLERLPQIGEEDFVALEISSFQLWRMTDAVKMPHVAVVTNFTPNHLDWHGSSAEYAAAKRRLLLGQTAEDYVVLNPLDAEVAAWASDAKGQILPLYPTEKIPKLGVPGEHNRTNAALAATAATAFECEDESIRSGLEQYRALPQRLELCAMIDGRRFYNDSSATTPESTIVALETLTEPIWLLIGGKNKGFDFTQLAEICAKRAIGIAVFGACRKELHAAVEKPVSRKPHRENSLFCESFERLEEAFDWCWSRSRPGDAVLLSPACASTDQFQNYQCRGRRFVELVDAIAHQTH